jgi:hypothetical protein
LPDSCLNAEDDDAHDERHEADAERTGPSCAECDARWLPADEERWEAYLTDDEPPELAF